MLKTLILGIQEVEGLHYLCSGNKGADQFSGNRAADQRPCISTYTDVKKKRFMKMFHNMTNEYHASAKQGFYVSAS